MMGEVLPYLGVEAKYTEEEYENLDMVSPSVVGMTLSEAYQYLDEMGLSYSVVGDEDEATTVTQQIPESGSDLPKGGTVVLYTKNYEESETMVEVPDFKDYDMANCAYLAGINNVQISVEGAVSDTAKVTMQDIPAGTQVKQGTVITLVFVDNTDTETFVHLE